VGCTAPLLRLAKLIVRFIEPECVFTACKVPRQLRRPRRARAGGRGAEHAGRQVCAACVCQLRRRGGSRSVQARRARPSGAHAALGLEAGAYFGVSLLFRTHLLVGCAAALLPVCVCRPAAMSGHPWRGVQCCPYKATVERRLTGCDACDSLAVPGVSLLLCLLRGLICMRQIRVVMNDCKNCKNLQALSDRPTTLTHVRAP